MLDNVVRYPKSTLQADCKSIGNNLLFLKLQLTILPMQEYNENIKRTEVCK